MFLFPENHAEKHFTTLRNQVSCFAGILNLIRSLQGSFLEIETDNLFLSNF